MEHATLEKAKKKSTVKKNHEMDYFEALETIEKYNAVLHESGRKRTPVPQEPDVWNDGMIKSAGLACAAGVGALVTATLSGVNSFEPVMLSFLGIITFSPIPGAILGLKVPKLVAPIKYPKLLRKYREEMLFHEMSEEEYAKISAEVLKKTSKAVATVNKNLELEGSTMEYNQNLGQEGFWIKSLPGVNDYQKAKLRAARTVEQRQKVLAELSDSTQATKEITT